MEKSPLSVSEASPSGKYLTVQLAGEAYGLSVTAVREIIRLQKITALPRMPHFVKGVINLRGRVIPVVDLRLKFDLAAAIAERTCIVVVQTSTASGRTSQTGLIVDSVDDVLTIDTDAIEPAPTFGTAVDTSCILGMARARGEVKTLLDIQRVVGATDTAQAA
jgi:purine-binding chemotaxis protein CheW